MSSMAAPIMDEHTRMRAILPHDWWKVSFRSISWSYPKQRKSMLFRHPLPPGAVTHPRPPHYHDSLFHERWRQVVKESPPATESELHGGLIGVKGAEEALREYETEVGVSYTAEEQVDVERPVLFDGELDEVQLALAQKTWDDQVRDLLGGILKVHPSLTSSDEHDEESIWGLDIIDSSSVSSGARRASPGLTDSEVSATSDLLPSTPKATKRSYADAVFQNGQDSPSSEDEALAYASSYKPIDIPFGMSVSPSSTPDSLSPHRGSISPPSSASPHSPSPTPSSSYEFEFPSLNTKMSLLPPSEFRVPVPPRLQKDENGFYYNPTGTMSPPMPETRPSARSTKRASAALLPAFLADGAQHTRTRNSSRTRELVDRLRSSSGTREAAARGRRMDLSGPRGSLPSVQDMDEFADSSGSCPPGYKIAPVSDVDGWIHGVVHEKVAKPDYSMSLDFIMPESGWISGPSAPRTPSRAGGMSSTTLTPSSESSTGSSSTPSSGESLSLPPTPVHQQLGTYYSTPVPPSSFSSAFPHSGLVSGMSFLPGQGSWQTTASLLPQGVPAGPAHHYSCMGSVPSAMMPLFPAAMPHVLYEAHGKVPGAHAR